MKESKKVQYSLDVGNPVSFRLKHMILVLAAMTIVAAPALAVEKDTAAVKGFRSTDLPLPRFVTLRSDKIYVRTGPSLSYPIKWIYRRAGMPVEIVREYDNWRQVRGIDGEEGWIHQSLLSGERNVLIKNDKDVLTPLRTTESKDARMIAKLEPMVVAGIDKCEDDWCRIEVAGYRGWVERNFLWGIYDEEEFH